jgi:hypothetical protein
MGPGSTQRGDDMRRGMLLGFAALAVSFGISSAAEAAMCGRSCAGGGRYIPGPPGVCAANGLNWCGPSRGGAVVTPPAVVVGPGGVGVVGPRVVEPRRGCRTVIVRPDGTRIIRDRC